MKKVRITVMRKACYLDLMEKYENPIEHACDIEEGSVFIGWSLTMPSEDVTLTAVYAPASSIDAVKAKYAYSQIFTPDGIPVNELQQGVNIIRYSDGQTKKVIVK